MALWGLLTSCNKENDEKSFYFTFNIGKEKYSLDTAIVEFDMEGNESNFKIQGITASLYVLTATGYNPFDSSILGTYLTTESSEPKKILLGGGFADYNSNDDNAGVYPMIYDGKWSFTVSEKTNTYVTGVFSGMLYEQTSPDSIAITNGRFRIPY